MYHVYLKTHLRTDAKYLGATREDPHSYNGSSKPWLNHLRQYGYEVQTDVLWSGEDRKEMTKQGNKYAEMLKVFQTKSYVNFDLTQGDIEYQAGNAEWLPRASLPAARKNTSSYMKGNKNLKGMKWWYNERLDERRRQKKKPLGLGWKNKYPSTLSPEGRAAIVAAASKPTSEETRHKMSESAKARKGPICTAGSVWVISTITGRKARCQPDAIPEGFMRLTELTRLRKLKNKEKK